MPADMPQSDSPPGQSTASNKESSQTVDIGSPYTPRRPSPIISISVNHPIAIAIRKIKNFLTHKQTLFSTTFTIKITPIVAIVSLFGLATLFGGGVTTAYNFGKTVEEKFITSSPSPTPKIIVQAAMFSAVSRVGTIKATYQLPPEVQNPVAHDPVPSIDPSSSPAPTIPPTPTPTAQVMHYILVSRSGSINYLSGSTIHFQNYLNLRVLITGLYDSTKNTLTVAKTGDIEILQ